MCQNFLDAAAQAGHSIRVTHTLRTMDEQAKLYAQGRTLPGPQVTKAKPGQSPHNYGMAFDICFDGKAPYPPESDPRWAALGKIGKLFGLAWGGEFKSIMDRPHFERPDWKKARGA